MLLLGGLFTGILAPTYFLFLVGIAGMYSLLSLGLNVQWGYTGLINFSVAAFFGIGAYGTALASASSSPVAGNLAPVVGLFVALVLAAILALLIGIPTLRLRADYLAIASIGLAEVVRIVILNEDQLTNGSAGVRGIPTFFDGWPLLDTFPQTMPSVAVSWLPGGTVVLGQSFWSALLNVVVVVSFIAVSYFVLKRAHRSPWGRVLRTIRSDEDLARALGKNTYRYKMQAFVLGSLIMALAGVFYAHLNLFVTPGDHDVLRLGCGHAWGQRLEPRRAVRRDRHRHHPRGDALPQRLRVHPLRCRATATPVDRRHHRPADAVPAGRRVAATAGTHLAQRRRRRARTAG